MNPFETAINDIFSNTDFTSTAVYNNKNFIMTKSAVSEEERLTAFGLDEGVGFYILIRFSDLAAENITPKRNDLISVDGTEYRVSSVSKDSSGLLYRIDLKSKSSR